MTKLERAREYKKQKDYVNAALWCDKVLDGRFTTSKEYDEAQEMLRWIHESNDVPVKSLIKLGAIYEVGDGIDKNSLRAWSWYFTAYRRGSVDAAYALSNVHFYGERDEVHALKYLMYASERNSYYADEVKIRVNFLLNSLDSAESKKIGQMLYCGMHYGMEVKQDHEIARRFFERAGKQGCKQSFNKLADMHEKGEGGQKDIAKAVLLYHKGDLDKDQFPANNPKIRQILESKDITTGEIVGIGNEFYHDKDVDKKFQFSKFCYEKAASAGDGNGLNNLGLLYGEGRGVTRDVVQAVKYFQKSLERGYQDAKNNLKKILENDIIEIEDDLIKISLMYYSGNEVKQDLDQSKLWVDKIIVSNPGYCYPQTVRDQLLFFLLITQEEENELYNIIQCKLSHSFQQINSSQRNELFKNIKKDLFRLNQSSQDIDWKNKYIGKFLTKKINLDKKLSYKIAIDKLKKFFPQDFAMLEKEIASLGKNTLFVPSPENIAIINHLKNNIIGQEHAIQLLAQEFFVTQKIKAVSPKVFLFCGPTGVGKTELARVFASRVFEKNKNDVERLLIINMEQYNQQHDSAKLFGATQGYIGSGDKPFFAKKLDPFVSVVGSPEEKNTDYSDEQKNDYIINKINDDGECGYTAYGITREKANELLQKNLKPILEESRLNLKLMIQERLLENSFIIYLKQKKIINNNISDVMIEEKLESYLNDPNILKACIDYDNQNKNWAHPAILHALAHIQGIELHIWRAGSDQNLIPHRNNSDTVPFDYSCYKPKQAVNDKKIPKRMDLLFINNNHFDQVKFIEADKASLKRREITSQKNPIKKVENLLIIFDEFEKAHSTVKQSLLALFDTGRITMTYSESGLSHKNIILDYELHNCFIVCTSNLCGNLIAENFKRKLSPQEIIENFKKALRNHDALSPEMVGRMRIVPFSPIDRGKDFQKLLDIKIKTYCEEIQKAYGFVKVEMDSLDKEAILQIFEEKLYTDGVDIRTAVKTMRSSLDQHFTKLSFNKDIQYSALLMFDKVKKRVLLNIAILGLDGEIINNINCDKEGMPFIVMESIEAKAAAEIGLFPQPQGDGANSNIIKTEVEKSGTGKVIQLSLRRHSLLGQPNEFKVESNRELAHQSDELMKLLSSFGK
jgi:TPR repeat protein